MIDSFTSRQIKVFVESNKYYWDKIVGVGQWIEGVEATICLSVDHKPSCAGLQPFGGWKQHAAKSFEALQHICGSSFNVLSYCITEA
ncbi:MAG: hypothetical protein P4L87_21975 [Formivibrio sp.]|nr:hypothetical protein [Formivibrio sp.]